MNEIFNIATHRPCEAVEPNNCIAPANSEQSTRATCRHCGLAVCTTCSILQNSKDLWPQGRWCYDCLENEKDWPSGPPERRAAAQRAYNRWLVSLGRTNRYT